MVAYYRRDWLAFARSGITLSRRVFGLSWPATVRCSWLVLRATQLWAPSRDHRADRAQRTMERFYRTIRRRLGESSDPATAATLELRWWRIHRENQQLLGHGRDQALADALAGLYAHIYGVPQSAVLRAAEYRADAMRQSDQWIREGRRPDSPRLEAERVALDALVRRVAAGDRALGHRQISTEPQQILDRRCASGYARTAFVEIN